METRRASPAHGRTTLCERVLDFVQVRVNGLLPATAIVHEALNEGGDAVGSRVRRRCGTGVRRFAAEGMLRTCAPAANSAAADALAQFPLQHGRTCAR